MTITISADDPRSIRAIEIAATSGQWLRCRTRDRQKAYGIPSQRLAGVYHLVDQQSCTCEDAARHPGNACKHMLAVRLIVELAKAQHSKPKAKVLQMVREEDGSRGGRFAQVGTANPAAADRRAGPLHLRQALKRRGAPR